jgi:hypothetical protein
VNESITLPTAQQKRILRLMLNDDLIWEVAGKSYRSLYNEKLGRQQRIPASATLTIASTAGRSGNSLTCAKNAAFHLLRRFGAERCGNSLAIC